MGKFFKNPLKAGRRIAPPGFADGLNGIDRALSEISVQGGRVSWSNGVPRLIPPQAPAAILQAAYSLRVSVRADPDNDDALTVYISDGYGKIDGSPYAAIDASAFAELYVTGHVAWAAYDYAEDSWSLGYGASVPADDADNVHIALADTADAYAGRVLHRRLGDAVAPDRPDRIEIGYIDEAADPDPAWETREFWVSRTTTTTTTT